MKIKKGDSVVIIAGKDKGKSGKVVRALPKKNKVVVEGLNMTKRHQKARKSGEKGTMINMAMPINVSNVKLAE
ncbi:MAG: 50S ribosomal protein L24 [Candidatus Nomurabacteria bacterium GW2011_GWA1_46_11]|uniref:Large ribosomal subunit protein uL24 n=2 Tax=Candidatus Nomuraibacteriota TaxID=1752729 RepID=A0A0G1T143_9BACT|nr:MAG: 50S ribosomal protein L24 [Candidatus Nomurabacteria bacterium GW2011_GWA1_46_11]KKU75462.1 MAG: 50S ribosomal protein L24 [Candidatus Nomurabacteria bacterium GW2011_GWB1_47_6]